MSRAFDWLAVGDVGEARDADNHFAVTGSAGRLAMHASALGASVAIVGKIGDDQPGRRVRDKLARSNIELHWLQVARNLPTTVWIEQEGQPDRIERGADLSLRLDELPPRSVEAALTIVSGLALAAEPARSAAVGALSQAVARGGQAALLLEAEQLWATNARMTRRVLEPALALARAIALTADDARVLLGPVSSRQAVRMLGQFGPRLVYLAGEDGGVVLREGNRTHDVSAVPGRVPADRLAGPAAFWVGLAHGVPATKAASDAVAYASKRRSSAGSRGL